jgi:preprotein translocase subunit SecA
MKMIRKDLNDVIYKTRKEKFNCVADEIATLHKKGQPVLVGTVSIDNSERISDVLKRRGIPHKVLNAKHHEMEAEIVAKAGQNGAVTIATNMAGRGTDIVLGEGVAQLGGLHIIGTERHESRRIDNQLRGRSGRQGDQGSTRFYVALEDDLMKLFGSDRIAGIMERMGMEENTPIEHPLITRAIENAQKKVEQYHFNIRKQVLEYDDVMNKQRESIYGLRRRILEVRDLKQKAFEMIDQLVKNYMDMFIPEKDPWDVDGLKSAISELLPADMSGLEEHKERAGIKSALEGMLKEAYESKEKAIGSVAMREIEKLVMLKEIDAKWIEHLHNMDVLREGIGLRAWGQRDPLIEYKIEGYKMFQDMMDAARQEIISVIYRAQVVREGEEELLQKKRNVTYGEPTRVSRPSSARNTDKIGRNDPCPCGSGKKYKKCCGK